MNIIKQVFNAGGLDTPIPSKMSEISSKIFSKVILVEVISII